MAQDSIDKAFEMHSDWEKWMSDKMDNLSQNDQSITAWWESASIVDKTELYYLMYTFAEHFDAKLREGRAERDKNAKEFDEFWSRLTENNRSTDNEPT